MTTIGRVKVGNTENKVYSTYPGKINPYIDFYGTKTLIYKPKELSVRDYRLASIVSGDRVDFYRSAIEGWEIDFVEESCF